MSEWINCSERMPENHKVVVMRFGDGSEASGRWWRTYQQWDYALLETSTQVHEEVYYWRENTPAPATEREGAEREA